MERRARLIVRTLPPRHWYSAAALLTRAQWAACRLVWWRPDIALRNAVFLDMLLLELTRHGDFPIRSKVAGSQHLPECRCRGLLFCTAHLPLFATTPPVMGTIDIFPALVIAVANAIGPDGCYPVPGQQIRIPALPPGAKAMVGVKRVLESGGIVGSLIDEYAGGPLKPQLLRLAGKIKTNVFFLTTELDSDNAVKLTIVPPPYPECDTEEKIQANLAAFNQHRQRVLAALQGHRSEAHPQPS